MTRPSELKREFMSLVRKTLKQMGYVQQRRDFKGLFTKATPEGYHGIVFNTDTRYDLRLKVRFTLRFDPASRVLVQLNDELVKRSGEDFEDPYSDYYDSLSPTFSCFLERLMGIEDWTAEEIEEMTEVVPLYDRTMERIHKYGLPFFEKYGTSEAVLRVIDSDSDEWMYLFNIRSWFFISAAAMLYAYRGRQALLDYFERHKSDPELVDGWDRERLEIMIAMTAPK